MAHHASAEKRIRQSERRTAANRVTRVTVRSYIKRLRAAVAAGDKAEAERLLVPTLSKLDKAVTKGAYHWRTAARTISRLSKAVAKV